LQIFGRFRKIIEPQEGKFLQKFILKFTKIFLQDMKDSEDFFSWVFFVILIHRSSAALSNVSVMIDQLCALQRGRITVCYAAIYVRQSIGSFDLLIATRRPVKKRQIYVKCPYCLHGVT
jgi:hypothetical protein